jgi:hypothetical protein
MLEYLLATRQQGSGGGGGPVNGDTVFLTHLDGANASTTFVEESGYSATVTAGPTISTTLSKFGGAAALFNGSGRLTFPDSPILRLNGDYTIEGWLYVAAADMSQNTALLGKGPNSYIQVFNNQLYMHDDTGAYKATGAFGSADTWNHFAFTKDSSGNSRLFVGGKLKQLVTGATTFGNAAGGLVIGSSDGYTQSFKGRLDDLRISRTCLYTAEFTPPAAPFDPFTPTKVLLHLDGANGSTTFTDERGHTFTALAAAALSTTKSKFGGASLRPGAASTAAGITSPDHVDYQLTGDFTIEFWMNADNHTQNTLPVSKGDNAGIQWQGGVLDVYGDNTATVIMSGAPNKPDGTWFHVAVTKQGTTWRLFADGVMLTSATSSYTWGTAATKPLIVGAWGSLPFQGYMDEFRIVKNKALYTANFTPPAAPFTLS